MSGARINYTFDDKDTRAALTRFGGVLHSGVPRAIGVALVEQVNKRFESGKDVWGRPWAPLLPAYAEIKRGPGILRASGMLQRSITFVASGTRIMVGSNRIYAAVHQFGAIITAKNAAALRFWLGGGVLTGARGGNVQNYALVRVKSVRIPGRPYLGFGPNDYVAVMEVLRTEVRSAFG